MFRVLKNVELYAPEYMGFKDILTAYGKIALISDRIGSMPMLQAEVTDCGGMIAMPGLVDQHVHITGGGGEQGPGSMMSLFSDFRSAVVDHRLPLESVLRTVTENPAKTLKLYPRKGKIAVGSDADILLADRAGFAPKMLLAGGCLLMWDGKPVR